MLINILIVTDNISEWGIKISDDFHDAVTHYYPEREGRRIIETDLFRFLIVSDFIEGRQPRFSSVILDKEMNRDLYVDVLRHCIRPEIQTNKFKLI